jgi:fucose 4-O-acetylase-like acetyltransferase
MSAGLVDAGQSENLAALVSRHADATKGILILLVVLDHNDWFRLVAPDLFKPLTFHVLGFFFLAFTFASHALDRSFVLDRIARYLVPFWWFLTVTSLGFLLVSPQLAVGGRVSAWVLALLLGNAPFVKASAGLLMLWFLPCLFGLSCLLAAHALITSPAVRRLAWGVALLFHLAIPLLPVLPLMWLPAGLAVAADIFVLGLIWRAVLSRRLPNAWGPVSGLILIASYGALVVASINVEIGTLDVYGIDRPGVMLLQDLAGLSGVAFVVYLGTLLSRVRWLNAVGQQSLLVYLIHPVVYQVFALAMRGAGLVGGNTPVLMFYGTVSAAIATLAAYGGAVLISRSPCLSKWITPRTWVAWPPVRFWSRAAPRSLGP